MHPSPGVLEQNLGEKPMAAKCHMVFRKLIKQTEARCKILGLPPSLEELCNQFAIRAVILMPGTAHFDHMSIRRFFREQVHIGKNFVDWNTPISLPQWIQGASREYVYKVEGWFLQATVEYREYGKMILDTYIMAMRDLGHEGDIKSLGNQLACYKPPKSDRINSRRIDLPPIEKSVLDALDERFPEQSPLLPFFRVSPRIEERELMPGFYESMLRVFPRVIWLTGMRPIEVWTSQLYLPVMDGTFGQNDVDFAYSCPLESTYKKRHVFVCHHGYESINHCKRHIRFAVDNRFPVIVGIRSAKQGLAPDELRHAWRVQILQDISERDIEALFAASLLPMVNRTPAQQDRVNRMLNTKLKLAMRERFPSRRNLLTLYAFRHDFATRAKKKLLRHEVAALMGHSDRDSVTHYGKLWSRRSAKGQNGFVPSPDPAHSERILRYWKTKKLLLNRETSYEPDLDICEMDDPWPDF